MPYNTCDAPPFRPWPPCVRSRRRLAEFSALHPEPPVDATIQMEEPDFARYGIDLAIVHVPERAVKPEDVVLLREQVFPVCSPELFPVASQGPSAVRELV